MSHERFGHPFLHISHAQCENSLRILEIAKGLGCHTYILKSCVTELPPSLQHHAGTIVYFDIPKGSTHVPARHLRALKPRDLEFGGVVLPSWARVEQVPQGQMIAVNAPSALTPQFQERIKQALIDLLVRDFGRPREPTQTKHLRVSRTDWRRGQRAAESVEWTGGWP